MLATLFWLATLTPNQPDPLLQGFLNVPNEARLRMYWRVFGPAWQQSEIDYQLDQVKAAGLGGLMAYFMYPVAQDDPTNGIINQRFGSPEFLDTFGYAARAAHSRGLRFGINGGTGWPYGGANVSVEDSAHQLREVILQPGDAAPTLTKSERLIAVFEGATPIPVTQKLNPNVRNRLYIEGPTQMQVKRAAYGAEGLVLDHFNTAALDRWLSSTVQPMLNAAGGFSTSLGCDSLEVYRSNWCRDLPVEFKKRRGYDFLPELPRLFEGTDAASGALRFDYWRTLMELFEERFTRPLAKWSDSRKVDLEMEAYGTPPSPMTSMQYIAIPTGEHYEWRGFAIQKYVASAAHMGGRNIIGCEAWTWAGLPNRLADTLSDLKLVSDMEFLCGANDLTGVDYPYSPRSAGKPGWQPYYGPTINENSPQWEAYPALVGYLNRCQWLLRQGKPSVSLAVYLPVEDRLAQGGPDGRMEQMLLDFLVRDHFVTGKGTSEFGLQNALHHRSALLQGLFANGLDYDGIDFWAMNALAHQEGRDLVAGTSRYKAVVLPNLVTMEPRAAQKLHQFAEAGGWVVAVRRVPSRAAGHQSDNNPAFATTIEKLFGKAPQPGQILNVGKGHAVLLSTDEEVGPFLAKQIPPPIRFDPIPDSVGFVHRDLGDRQLFFLANVEAHPVSLQVTIAGPTNGLEAWNAETGKVTRLALANGIATVRLEGRGSIFLLASRTESQSAAPTPEPTSPFPWNPTWRVAFEGPDAPKPLETSKLTSWTAWPGARFFSGIGVYEAEIDWPKEGARALLRLGEVQTTATVFVNGEKAGVTYNFPFQVDLGRRLRKGRNTITIRVGNLPVNRFLGLPDDDLDALRARFGARFQRPEEKQLMKEPAPSGLLGPVQLFTDP
jgi:hypothetical protein